jgi:hypothetical protein
MGFYNQMLHQESEDWFLTYLARKYSRTRSLKTINCVITYLSKLRDIAKQCSDKILTQFGASNEFQRADKVYWMVRRFHSTVECELYCEIMGDSNHFLKKFQAGLWRFQRNVDELC